MRPVFARHKPPSEERGWHATIFVLASLLHAFASRFEGLTGRWGIGLGHDVNRWRIVGITVAKWIPQNPFSPRTARKSRLFPVHSSPVGAVPIGGPAYGRPSEASTAGKRGCPASGKRAISPTLAEQIHRGSVQQRFIRNAAGKTPRKRPRGKLAALRIKR